MSTDVNYSIKGTSDVPQQVDKAKKAMSSLDQTTATITKKFSEIGKDIFLGFFAPVMLIHQAINLIGSAIAQAKQDAKDAVDFAAGVKVEDLKKSPVDATTRYMAQKLQVDIRTEEEQKKAARARSEVVREFLIRDPRGQEYYRRNAPTNPETGDYGISERVMAQYKSVQEDIFKMVQEEAAAALKAEQAPAGGEAPSAQNIAIQASNTVGVGMNAQFDMLTKQVSLQEDMANSLRQIVEADQGRIGFQPQKYPDFGGSTQSLRTPLPPR